MPLPGSYPGAKAPVRLGIPLPIWAGDVSTQDRGKVAFGFCFDKSEGRPPPDGQRSQSARRLLNFVLTVFVVNKL